MTISAERFEILLNRPIALSLIALLSLTSQAQAFDVRQAIVYVLESNPDIQAAEYNKQAREFELGQARSFRAPKFSLNGWAGSSRDLGENSSGTGDYVDGYELNAEVSQRLFDGFWTRSEIEHQAYRVDAAALRVLERSEFLGLEATRLYADVLRMREQVSVAQSNLAYHRDAVARLQRAFDNDVVSASDLLQGEERLLTAEDILLEFQLDLADTEAFFVEVVGVEPNSLSSVPSVSSAVAPSFDRALATARARNPTIRFSQADVGASEALSRRAQSNRFPTLDLVMGGRYGEDVDGVAGEVNDLSVGLRFNYEFQGTSNRSEREANARRVNESRARLLSQTRLVEREMRQSWNAREQVRKRVSVLSSRVNELQDLRQTYETEFGIGARSLLDVLNTQNAYVRAQAELINARSLSTYIDYRVLAASGVLLATLGIEPPEDAKPYARDQVGAPPVAAAETQDRFDAQSFSDWRKSIGR
ncbi:TolC family protein [Alloyangia pacifica]|uniref:TolC family protein n=1 Tax=Alloyangia pacifica TaxID=311180 RepID=UPI0031DB7E6E